MAALTLAQWKDKVSRKWVSFELPMLEEDLMLDMASTSVFRSKSHNLIPWDYQYLRRELAKYKEFKDMGPDLADFMDEPEWLSQWAPGDLIYEGMTFTL